MSDNRFTGGCSGGGREMVCIETNRIFDSCKDRDCYENVRVYLTDEGRALDAENIALIKEVDSLGLRGLTEEETATLMTLLTKVRNNILENEEAENGQNS